MMTIYSDDNESESEIVQWPATEEELHPEAYAEFQSSIIEAFDGFVFRDDQNETWTALRAVELLIKEFHTLVDDSVERWLTLHAGKSWTSEPFSTEKLVDYSWASTELLSKQHSGVTIPAVVTDALIVALDPSRDPKFDGRQILDDLTLDTWAVLQEKLFIVEHLLITHRVQFGDLVGDDWTEPGCASRFAQHSVLHRQRPGHGLRPVQSRVRSWMY